MPEFFHPATSAIHESHRRSRYIRHRSCPEQNRFARRRADFESSFRIGKEADLHRHSVASSLSMASRISCSVGSSKSISPLPTRPRLVRIVMPTVGILLLALLNKKAVLTSAMVNWRHGTNNCVGHLPAVTPIRHTLIDTPGRIARKVVHKSGWHHSSLRFLYAACRSA